MPTPKLSLDEIPAYRVSLEVARVASDAQHLHNQLADLIAPNRSDPSLLRSPMVVREATLLKSKMLDIERLLTKSSLRTQPGYSEKCLSYLKEQIEVFLQNSNQAIGAEGVLDMWSHANETLAAQALGLADEIERIETELIPKIATNHHGR
jgi:hypothetical protein